MATYRIWSRQAASLNIPAQEWKLMGTTTRDPSLAVARALFTQRYSNLPHRVEVLWEEPIGTVVAAFTVGFAIDATAIDPLPAAPAEPIPDLDA